jgi:hypothetical protein
VERVRSHDVLAGVVSWVAYTMGASCFPHASALRYTALSILTSDSLGTPRRDYTNVCLRQY